MPRESIAQIEDIKARIRQILVRAPTLPATKIADVLHLETNYALKWVNKVRRENAEKINRQLLNEEIAKIETEFNEIAMELWAIISNQEKEEIKSATGTVLRVQDKITPFVKIAAMKTLIQARQVLFNLKFDAGVFTRQLGLIKTENKTFNLDLILDNASPETRKQFIEIAKKCLGGRVEGGHIS